ncbi:MAG TPA: leucine-rich repeat domain-containing protein [Flavobacterium sp.]|jgi:internalin A
MEKPSELIELEKSLKMELFPMDLKNESFLKINKSYTLDNERKIIALNLRHSKVKDLQIFLKFPDLISLHLGDCDIQDISRLGKCKNLKYLNLAGNNISDITPLQNLTSLQKLYAEDNIIENILPIRKLNNLTHLNLSHNQIIDIEALRSLSNIRALQITDNCITKIDSIENLRDLERVNFSSNEIRDVTILKTLNLLQDIQFTNNVIFDITPLYHLIKNPPFVRTHNFYDNPLIYPPTEIYLKGDNQIVLWFNDILAQVNRKISECFRTKSKALTLSNLGVTDLTLIPKLFKCTHLETLILSNEWAEYKNFEWLKSSAKSSNSRNNLNQVPTSIKSLVNLKKLIIGGDWTNDLNIPNWRISDVQHLGALANLEILNISNNEIYDLKSIGKLKMLKDFHFNNNEIAKVPSLNQSKGLVSINASNNKLTSLKFAENLRSLEMLDIHSNNFTNIDELEKILKNLKKLVIDSNPIAVNNNWKLTKYENHLPTVRNYFSKKRAPGAVEYQMPVKVLILGNHASGKSTLLDYLLLETHPKKIVGSKNSTHIVRIEQFKASKKSILPEIIYFDFGGQDYYHGLYKAFLTNDAINILLWTPEFDYNRIRKDSNNQLTRDFTKEYWLHQLVHYYLNGEKSNVDETEKDTAIIVQTRADLTERINFIEIDHGIKVVNNFWLALDQEALDAKNIFKINLHYFCETLMDTIHEKRQLERFKVHQPLWYLDFIKYILNSKSPRAIGLDQLFSKYKRPLKTHERSADIRNFFIDDLDQLHRQGLILYYKDFEDLKEVVWLNPSEFTKLIHTKILSKEVLTERKGNLPEAEFATLVGDSKIEKFLQIQKVVFHDIEHKKVIIPSFLPLANDSKNKNDYNIMTFGFGEPQFILKFGKFIPFGIVNQMISHFGNNPDSKHFWRDQLVFTIDTSVQVLIRLDFDNLEIATYINSKKIKKAKLDSIESYLYHCILAIYHDLTLLDYTSFEDAKSSQKDEYVSENSQQVYFFEAIDKIPADLYISIDNRWFVKAEELVDVDEDVAIKSVLVENQQIKNSTGKQISVRTISADKVKELPIYKFQNFTNKKLIKLKKIFISYSKDDLKLVHEFQDHLTSLKRAGKIASWYCTELLAGGDWNKDIARHFDEADIVCFMVSPNFMRTEYIYKHELRKAIDRKAIDEHFVIIPIILDFCSWNNAQSRLGDFTALPYTAKPVCDFDNRNMAWYIVVECIKFLIDNFTQPNDDDWFNKQQLPKDIKKIYERIVKGLVDKNSTM